MLAQPFTTLTLKPLKLPRLWPLHYQRLLSASQYFKIPFNYLSIDSFCELLQRQMETLTEPSTFRLILQPDGQIAFEKRSDIAINSQALKLKTLSLSRNCSLHKTMGYQPEEQAIIEAEKEGFNEILKITVDGLISESAYRNTVFYKQGRWVTPEPYASESLLGVELQWLMHQTQNTDYPVQFEIIQLSELPTIEAGFTLNAVRGIQAITQVNIHVLSTDHVVAFQQMLDEINYWKN